MLKRILKRGRERANNRKNIDPEAEKKRKMERAARRRKEREGWENEGEEEEAESAAKQVDENKKISFETLDEMSLDDNYEFDDDMDAWNAPSTRKSNSQQNLDWTSEFFEDSLVSFSQKSKEFIGKEEKKIKIELEIPTKASQLEWDMRNLKNDMESQRKYLRRIDPNNLSSIFHSSIEWENIIVISKALGSGSKKWVRNNWNFLVNFFDNLSRVDRFGITIEFLSEEEKSDIYNLTTELSNILDSKQVSEGSNEKESLEVQKEKLAKFIDIFI